MKIAIDARWIFPEISGIGAYTRELITQLTAIDNRNSYLLIFSDIRLAERLKAEIPGGLPPNFNIKLVPYSIFSIRNQLQLPILLRKLKIDVFHSTNYIIPLYAFPLNHTGRTKCVVTIHDVIPLVFPHHAPKSLKSRIFPVYRWLMREIGRRADIIITDSQSSADDIIRHLKIPAASRNKIRVVFCGVNPAYKPPAAASENKTKQILYVGRCDPYKNLTVLIRAFADTLQELTFPVQLVIAGSPDPRYPEGKKLAEQLNISRHIKWTGYLSDEDLITAFQHADLLVHPSQYEGFGLPVLEAMACGTPVICSNASSLPEIAGDAAIMISPNDIAAYTENMVKVLRDKELSAKLSQQGIRQAARFSWRKTAEKTLEIYENRLG